MAVLVVILVLLMQQPSALVSAEATSSLSSMITQFGRKVFDSLSKNIPWSRGQIPNVTPTLDTGLASRDMTTAQVQKDSSEKSVSGDGNLKATNPTTPEKNEIGNAKNANGTARNATNVTKMPTPEAHTSTLRYKTMTSKTLHSVTENHTPSDTKKPDDVTTTTHREHKENSTLAPTTTASHITRPNNSTSVTTRLATHGQNDNTSTTFVTVTTTSLQKVSKKKLNFTTTATDKPTQEKVTVLTSTKTNANSTKPKETNTQEDERKPAAWMLPTFLSLAALCIVVLIIRLKWKNYVRETLRGVICCIESWSRLRSSAPGTGDEDNAIFEMTDV